MKNNNFKKIKIFSLATTYPDSPNSTKPKFVHLLNKELVKLGIKVVAIVPHSKNSLKKEMLDEVVIHRFRYLPTNQEFNNESIPDSVSKSKGGFLKILWMSGMFFLKTFVEFFREKPDIIHGHWVFPGGYIAYLLSKIFQKKFFVTIHGGEITLLKNSKIIRKMIIHALNCAEKVIVNSTFTKNEFVKMGLSEKKISLVKVPPNFLPHTLDKNLIENVKTKINKNENQIILFNGRLVERKGVEYLIRAMKEILTPNSCLVISGGGEELKKLKKLTESLELNNKVIFLGRTTDEELSALYQISDVFVCPSIIDSRGITEYLGLVIPEAMESGLPVIASSVGGITDTIQHEENGLLVPEKNPTAIAKSIDLILNDEKLKNEILKNSKNTVYEFLPEIIAKKYLEIYKIF